MIRVVIADDQGMIRAGLRSLLEGEPDIDVVGEASDGDQALASIRRMSPDVALVDIRMPNLDGISVTRKLVAEDTPTKIIVLTTFDLDDYVFESLRAGASAFLLKDATASELIDAVRLVAAGDALLSPAVTRRVIEAFAATPTANTELVARHDELSEREAQVLALLARGRTNAEIADELIVSESTVKTHVSKVLSKLNLRDRIQAVIFAYESGVVRPEGK